MARFTPGCAARQREQEPGGHGQEHAEGQRRLEREVEPEHQVPGDQRAHAREGPLPSES